MSDAIIRSRYPALSMASSVNSISNNQRRKVQQDRIAVKNAKIILMHDPPDIIAQSLGLHSDDNSIASKNSGQQLMQQLLSTAMHPLVIILSSAGGSDETYYICNRIIPSHMKDK